MNAETRQRIFETRAHFGLPTEALVEKDLYVVAAIRALAAIDARPLLVCFWRRNFFGQSAQAHS